MIDFIKTPIGRLRIIAFLEGCSYLMLFFTMYLKYSLAMPQPNYVVGMAHGVLFVIYIALVVQVAYLHKWRFSTTVGAFAAAVIPFGTFYADKKIFR